ncbi:MAG: hypothetical protein ACUVX1_02600 [Chloroflexota bacterium]
MADLDSPWVERVGPVTILRGPPVRVSFVKIGEVMLIDAMEPVAKP